MIRDGSHRLARVARGRPEQLRAPGAFVRSLAIREAPQLVAKGFPARTRDATQQVLLVRSGMACIVIVTVAIGTGVIMPDAPVIAMLPTIWQCPIAARKCIRALCGRGT